MNPEGRIRPERYGLLAWTLASTVLIVIGGVLVAQSAHLTGSVGDRVAIGFLAAALGANVRLIWGLARS